MASGVRGGVALWIGLASAAVLTFSCAAIVGIDDRLADDLEAGTDAGPDGPIGADAGECPGTSSCVAVPDGWELVAFDRLDRKDCGNGYAQPTDIESVDDPCTCNCAETAPAGCGGAPSLSLRTDNTCVTSTGIYYTLTAADAGTCLDLAIGGGTPFTPSDGQGLRNRRTPTAAVCGTASSAPTKVAAGRVCKSAGTKCSVGTCAEPAPPGTALCVSKAGDQACPSGFARKNRAGSAVATDTVACGPCTCAPSPPPDCNDEQLDLFTSTDCTTGEVSIPANVCVRADGGASFVRFKWTEHDGGLGGCRPTAPPAVTDGGLTLTDELTVCCAEPPDAG
jgi:hypothetical protein